MNFTQKIFLVARTLLLLTLAACIKNNPRVSSTDAPRSIQWTSSTLPENRDWTDCSNIRCLRHAALVMEGLTRFHSVSGVDDAIPALAKEIRAVSDREYRIELKDGLKWTDGKLLTSRDFIDSWRTSLQRCKRRAASRYLFVIAGAEAFCRRQTDFSKVGIRAVSSTVLQVRLRKPVPFFTRLLAHPVFWPRRLDGPRDQPPTLGPYIAQPGSVATYVPNPSYAQARPRNAIVFSAPPRVEERVSLFREHSADVVEDLDLVSLARLRHDPDLVLFSDDTRYYLLISGAEPLQSSATRKLLVEAIAKQSVVATTGLGLIAVDTLLPLLAPSANDATTIKTMQPFKPDTRLAISWDSDPLLEALARNLSAQWSQALGLSVELAAKTKAKTALRLVRWAGDPFEPELPPFLGPRALAFPDSETLLRYWQKTQAQWVSADALAVPLFDRARGLLRSPQLSGLTPNPVGGFDFAALHLSP